MQQQQTQQNGLLIQGRIVWTSGKLFEGKQQTDDNNRVILDENGQPTIIFGFGLAVPKMDARNPGQYSQQFQELWAVMQREALSIFPSGNIPADFAWKYKDGDAMDHNGKPFADREGYKGCIVVACTTQIPIKYFRWEGNTNIMINDGIKCGDYVNVQLNIKAHAAKGRGKPGLYMNPTACQLIAPGKEIINTPSGDQMFGLAAPSYNVGNIEAPVAPTMPQGNMGMPAPGMPGQAPQQGGGMPQMPQQGQQYQGYSQAPQQAPVDPHYGILPNGHQPPAQGGNGMPQMPNQMGGIVPPAYAPTGPMSVPGMNTAGGPNAYPSNPGQAPQQGGGMPPMPGMPR